MKLSPDRPTQWIFFLAASFVFGAVFLRSILTFWGNSALALVLGLLLVCFILIASESAISRKWPGYFPVYLAIQTLLVFVLLVIPDYQDFFSILLAIFSMQAMLRINPRFVAYWIGFCAVMVALLVAIGVGAQAIALSLVYTSANIFMGTYALATRRAQEARIQNQVLALRHQEASRQLQAYSAQMEQLAVARERNRLARDLHDSVTQTVFSMTLTTQSALLLFERDPAQAGPLLDHLSQLAQSAMSEMQLLISELRPEKGSDGGLELALRRHLAERHLPEGFSVSLEVEGNQPLKPTEEQGLLRIAQEALNNIVKHAQVSQAQLRLHLVEPIWMEITDQGRGFDPHQVQNSGRVGLLSMRERATEIGWNLRIDSSPGAGTRIRVEKST